MGTIYNNQGESETGKEHIRKAYELRDRVSERERLYITEHYYESVTGEHEKEIETLELYDRTYPSDPIASNNLPAGYEQGGDYEKGVEAASPAEVANPSGSNGYMTLAYGDAALGRRDESQQIIDQGLKQFLNSESIRWAALWLALTFEKPDEIQRQSSWGKGKPGEYRFLELQASALQRDGKLPSSSELTQQIVEMQKSQNLKEIEFRDLGQLAMVQGDFGDCAQARQTAAALSSSKTPDAVRYVGLVFATCGEAAKAESVASELGRSNPLDTFVQKMAIPQIALEWSCNVAMAPKRSKNCAPRKPSSSATSPLAYRPICVVWPIFRPSKVRRQWQSSRSILITKLPLGRPRTCPWFNSVWRVGMLCRATPQRLALPIRTFSPSGKTLTPTFPS
jgi:tetratricopeptide (TPR) repeat protein